MPEGPWNPGSGWLPNVMTGPLRPGYIRIIIDGEWRTLGARRGCADYEREFTTFTIFAAKPKMMVEAQETGEAAPAQFVDCENPGPPDFTGSIANESWFEEAQKTRKQKEFWEDFWGPESIW